jgi:hypothetical protein
MASYFYSQNVFPYAARALDYITGSTLYAGSFAFALLEKLYMKNFDTKHRQRKLSPSLSAEQQQAGPELGNDWEDPEIVGKNRMHAHTVLRSFRSAEHALLYWADASMAPREREHCHKMLLTGAAGTPEQDTARSWEFSLVGSPELAPANWHHPEYSTGEDPSSWAAVSLPAHWQCQGFDTPLYTNTVYPVS